MGCPTSWLRRIALHECGGYIAETTRFTLHAPRIDPLERAGLTLTQFAGFDGSSGTRGLETLKEDRFYRVCNVAALTCVFRTGGGLCSAVCVCRLFSHRCNAGI